VDLVPSRPAHPARAPHGLAAGPARPIRPCVRPTPLIILRHGRSRPRPPPFAPRSSRGPRGRPIMSVSSTIDDRVRAVAERQCGVVTREQLLNAGMSRGGLRHRLTIGRLRRLHPGVYLVGPMLLPRARQWAAVLACGPDAVLSHHDASELWLAERSALPANRGGRAPEARAVHVTVPHTGRKHKPGIRLHRVRALDPADCTSMDG